MKPTILVIFGITGDLSRRKLLPAIWHIKKAGELPKQFKIVGVSRQDIDKNQLLKDSDGLPKASKQNLAHLINTYQMDLSELADFKRLKAFLAKLEKEFGKPTQKLLYLAIPPQAYETVIELLGKAKLNDANTKLLLEKPFGTDYQSAKRLVEQLQRCIKENQIYRIDHFLAKEAVQNLLVFRSANSLFRQTWSNRFIDRIEIVASEDIGIEGRSTFYEQTGALRDVVQSHLLQLTALSLMAIDNYDDHKSDVPARRLKALAQLRLASLSYLSDHARRGQYVGYRKHADSPKSTTETFVALDVFSRDPNWLNVPIRLVAGKALDKKCTEIRLHYHQKDLRESNRLVLRIQPHEGVEVDLLAKQPGYEQKLQPVPLRFAYHEHFSALPEAYEHVLVDAMRGDHSLFTTSQEVLASWKLLDPILKRWSKTNHDLILYPPGSSPGQIID